MLYVESPAGVGFSYSDVQEAFNDNKTASDNYNVLISFFKGYPDFAKNDFYISGESYAGHYIPELALKIFENTAKNPNTAPHSNMKGFLVGNPATQEDIDFDGILTQY
jgi:serine carboxypeptidase-like clade II